MPVRTEREYRAMAALSAMADSRKRFDTDCYVEGYATTFDSPYLMGEYEGWRFYEVVDRGALDGTDISDVIMQYDHTGRVFARNHMGGGRKSTLLLEPDDHGLFIAADLSSTPQSRDMHGDIAAGLITAMSYSFTVLQDAREEDRANKTITRRIMKLRKVYDVSAVSIPANNQTEIAARSWISGEIERERQELAARVRQIQILNLLTEV